MLRATSRSSNELVDSESMRAERRGAALPFISFGFALLLVTCTIWAVDMTSPALPAIKADFGLSTKGAGLIVSFLFLGRLLGNLPAARFLETLGSPRTASMGGLLLVGGASVNMLAPSAEMLYAGRMLQGVGIALLVNAGLRSILFARPGRGAAMTIYGIASTIGSVIGLLSSGIVTGHFGWRAVFALSALLGVFLTMLPVIGSRVARRSARPAEQPAPLASMAVALRSYLIPLAVNFLVFCNYSIWVILPLYAEQRFGASPEMTANLLLIITVTHLAAAFPISRAIARFGATPVLIGSIALAVAGTTGILLANSVWMLSLPLVFYGSGMVGSVNAAGDIVLQRGGAGAKAVGALRQASDLGLVIGPIAAGAIADTFGYRTPFIAFPLLMILAALVGTLLPGVLASHRLMERA